MKLLELVLFLALCARSWSVQTEGELSTSIANADTSFYLDSRGAISTLQGAIPNDHLQEIHELLIKRFEEEVTQSQQSYDFQRNPQPSVNAPYQWAYEVNAASTGDKKSQIERREEDGIVHGRYSVLDPDGSLRVVTYMAHPDDGFQATVDKQVGFQEPADTGSLIVLAYNSGQRNLHNLEKPISTNKQRPDSSQRQELRISQQNQYRQQILQQQSRNQYDQQDQNQKLQLRNQPNSSERQQNNQSHSQHKYIKQDPGNQQQDYRNQRSPTNSQQIRQPEHRHSYEEKLQDLYQGQQTSLVQNWPRLDTRQQEKYHNSDQQLQLKKEPLQVNYRGKAQSYQNNHQQCQVITSQTHQEQKNRVEQEHLQKQQFANQQQHDSRAHDQLQYGDKNQNQPQMNNRGAIIVQAAQQNYGSEQLRRYYQQQNSQPLHTSMIRQNEQERKRGLIQHRQSIELDSDNNYEVYAQAKLKLDENGSYNIVPIILRRVRQTEADEE
ncbi:putative uncharacterized protein DDB_G0271606 [Palaemon carinicauda]|uniref:putative uncharacterized protein DDB_G0271606 n=1 Tax=Palaemon carinicauda TaxID=392227 RepID=UPI0035B61D00